MKKMHQYLLSNGFTIGQDEKALQEFIGLKGAYRYSLFAKIITNEIEDRHKKLKELKLIDAMYIFDISIRREVMRVTKPIEVHLKGKISNYIFNKYNSFDILAKDVLKPGELLWSEDSYEDKTIHTRKRDKYKKYNRWVQENVAKSNPNFFELIDKMELGKFITLLRALSDESYKKIFKRFVVAKDRTQFIDDIDFIRKMRNAAAHHNLFLINKDLRSTSVKQKLDRLWEIIAQEWKYDNAYKSFKKRIRSEYPSKTNKPQFEEYSKVIKSIYGLTDLFKKYDKIHKKK